MGRSLRCARSRRSGTAGRPSPHPTVVDRRLEEHREGRQMNNTISLFYCIPFYPFLLLPSLSFSFLLFSPSKIFSPFLVFLLPSPSLKTPHSTYCLPTKLLFLSVHNSSGHTTKYEICLHDHIFSHVTHAQVKCHI